MKHSITTNYVKDTCDIILQFQRFTARNASLLFNPLMPFSKLKLLLIHIYYLKKENDF